VVPSVVDAPFRTVLDEVFEEGETLEDDAPCGWAGCFDGFPHKFGDDEESLIIKRILSNLIHQGGGGSPIFVGQYLVNTDFHVIFGFYLIESAGMMLLVVVEQLIS